MTLSQRTWQHADGDDGDDPLTNLIYSGPNRSILPREPQIHWPLVRITLKWMALATICSIIALW